MNIDRIQKNLIQGGYKNNPHQVADDLAILSGEYSWICAQLEAILSKKPATWNVIRPKHKSDTSAEREWQASEDGINESGLRLRMKGIEKMLSALKSLLRMAENEAHNNF